MQKYFSFNCFALKVLSKIYLGGRKFEPRYVISQSSDMKIKFQSNDADFDKKILGNVDRFLTQVIFRLSRYMIEVA